MTYFNICREKQSQNSTWLSAKLVCWCNFQDWFSALGELRISGQDTQKALNQQKASIDRIHLFDEVALLREGSLQKNDFYQFFKKNHLFLLDWPRILMKEKADTAAPSDLKVLPRKHCESVQPVIESAHTKLTFVKLTVVRNFTGTEAGILKGNIQSSEP